jgi:hypothetical protein
MRKTTLKYVRWEETAAHDTLVSRRRITTRDDSGAHSMKLENIIANRIAVARPMIGGDVELATQIQVQLGRIGLLDPPADGKFGAVSQWALQTLLAKLRAPHKTEIDAEVARVLLDGGAAKLYPIAPTQDLAGRLLKAATRLDYWLCRHPDCVNILYIEGMDADGKANVDEPNVFNDLRVVLRFTRTGRPTIEKMWEATTEPGAFYTRVKKLDPRGAARIQFGQYKAWRVGTHMQGRPSAHEALVQSSDIVVFRDMNEDFERQGDEKFTGMFGINQHSGNDVPTSDIRRASAGCLVGRTMAGHREFMTLCKRDPRFVASRGYQFMAGVMPASEVK